MSEQPDPVQLLPPSVDSSESKLDSSYKAYCMLN